MENYSLNQFPIGYDEAFKILMTDYFERFAEVKSDYEILDLPKRVDLLIIKATEPIDRYVEVFKYFKKFNIIEFKSERNRFKLDGDLYKTGIYIYGALDHEKEANIRNTTFTLVSSLRPAKFLKQYKAMEIRQGLYRIENITLIPVHVVVAEELEIRYEKELTIIKDFTSRKDRIDYLKGIFKNETIQNCKKLIEITLKLYSKEIKIISKSEDIMTTQERNYKSLLKELGLDKVSKEYLALGMQQGMQQGMRQGMQQGIQLGFEDGRIKEQEEIARKLISRGLTIEDISEITGLTKGQIIKLRD